MLMRELSHEAGSKFKFVNGLQGFNTAARLASGLQSLAEEHELDAEVFVPKKLEDPYDKMGQLLENWSIERLCPSSCTLRTAVIMSGGKLTGEKSLAQCPQ